jgi:hypothetical protein
MHGIRNSENDPIFDILKSEARYPVLYIQLKMQHSGDNPVSRILFH